MGRIQSNVGLITGIPITDTIDQLLEVSARPREILTSRTEGLQQEQLAVDTLSSRVLGLQFELNKLKVASPYEARTVTSSDADVISAELTGDSQPTLGNYQFRPVQLATAQQFISQRFESPDDIQSSGTFSFGFGGFVDKGVSLDSLNDGQGVARGQIKITDLNGNSAVVDLSLARSVDDVIEAINNQTSVDVRASTSGDSFTLQATVSGTGTLAVQEVSGGTTAADLGLLAITATTTDEQAGADVFDLHSRTKLSSLNDGNGVRLLAGTDDLFFTVADGTPNLSIDLSGATTLGDVVDAINNDEALGTKVSAAISSDGRRLEITDLTGTGALTVTSGATGSAAEDLGLTTTVVGSTLTGERLVAGLRDTLVSSLGGGSGIGELGFLDITDRDGVLDSVDLSAAETLEDIISAINGSTAGVTASINDARNGIVLEDTTGGTGNLIVADNADGLETATSLGLVIDAAEDSINSGSLNRKSLSEATKLTSLNNAQGTQLGDVRITDSSGAATSFDFNGSGTEPTTIGDVIDAINLATTNGEINVTARINDTGDGILLIDNAAGEETLTVEDISGSLAADLNLTRLSETREISGEDKQVIDGLRSYEIDLANINVSDNSITLASLNDGAGIKLSDIRITDSAGNEGPLDLNSDTTIKTVSQLIDEINSQAQQLGLGVTASFNTTRTGIQLTDTAGGSGKLAVEDINGTAAADLKILSTSTTTTSINGAGLFASIDASQGALQNVATEINSREAGVTASVLFDGIGYRLQLVLDETGAANEILLDSGLSGFEFTETSQANDALLVLGGGTTPGSGVLVSSSDNTFEQVIEGVDLTINQTSELPVEISVEKNDKDLLDTVQKFVDAYNTLRDELGELTAFDADSLSTGLLFGTTAALRVDTDLARLFTSRYVGVGNIQTLEEIGISIDDTGKLALNKSALSEAFESDAAGVQSLFTTSERGLVAKFTATIERLTNEDTGLLTTRRNSLQTTIEQNQERIERFNASLERERARLELQFYQLEQVIAGIQSNQQAVSEIQGIPALTSTRSS